MRPVQIHHVSYPYGAMNFMATLGIRIIIVNSCKRGRWIFKGLSQDGGLTDFSENLSASLFHDDLSNEPSFSQIHLAGQYLNKS
jgi:hypothetical protein